MNGDRASEREQDCVWLERRRGGAIAAEIENCMLEENCCACACAQCERTVECSEAVDRDANAFE